LYVDILDDKEKNNVSFKRWDRTVVFTRNSLNIKKINEEIYYPIDYIAEFFGLNIRKNYNDNGKINSLDIMI
jgi:hypothetical protein